MYITQVILVAMIVTVIMGTGATAMCMTVTVVTIAAIIAAGMGTLMMATTATVIETTIVAITIIAAITTAIIITGPNAVLVMSFAHTNWQ
ncbi:MAG: hypothetical protein ACR2P1_22500 [Pseudomonadales bacterium]